MSMNAKKWGPLVAAIILGGIAAKAGYDVVSHRPSEKVVVQKVTHVVVARENIAPGTSLRAADLVVNTIPETTTPGGTFDSIDRLASRVTTVPLRKGQPVFETMLAPEGSGRGLTAVVPEGMRAVTMEINEISGVAGLIVPGCRVDVVSTFPGDNGQMMTKTICRSLQIVAVGRKFAEATSNKAESKEPAMFISRDGDAEPPLARSVTLLVTSHEAEILDLAAHTGSPRLVLRSGRDAKLEAHGGMSEGVTVAELRNSKSTPAWATALANLFTPTAQVPGKAPAQTVSDDRLADPMNLFDASTRPSRFRQVTVIRATKEESVQVQEKEQKRGIFVNTDTGEAIPNARRGE